ncbi:AraC family transcriptional regulator [Aquimarina sp. MMG016]|uniref:AraC family transcriptional regulator n=1 Tax=Aquimarina sp. MMG016 TaxID=2822690 RepID=UPI001B3A3883|nr:AraC family transcriptional regulator [Aquimarina sp. MMG016]MBQ4819337.1 AraC family transcriptional regulator [Aquimarina sp. MMG016]
MPTKQTLLKKIYALLASLLFIFSGYSFHIENIIQHQKQTDKDYIFDEKDTKKVESFLLSIYAKDTTLAKAYYKYYLERSIQKNESRSQFISHYYLGDLAYVNGDFATSVGHGKSMLRLSKTLNNNNYKITALNHLGNVYYKIREYENSLEQYLAAYHIYKEIDINDPKLGLLVNINIIRTRIHRYEEALKSYVKIIDILKKKDHTDLPNYSGIYLSSILGAGVCHYHLREYDKAISYYEQGFKLAKRYNSEHYEINFHMTSGEAYTAKGMYTDALEHLYKAKNKIRSSSTTFNPALHTTNFHLATVFFKKEEYIKTLDYLSESFEIIDSPKKEIQVEKINEMYDLAYRAAEKLGDKEKQIEYSLAYRRIIDSLHLDDIRTKDKLYDQDIEELEEKNQNLSNQNVTYIIISLIAIVIIVVLLIYNFRKQQKNKRLFEELQKKQQYKDSDDVPTSKKDFVTDKKAEVLFKKLNELEVTDFFLKEDCNLYNTAKLINTNTTYLSKIINEYQQKSFNDFINELRIQYCLKKLKTDKKFRSYTIKAIAGELGYKSVNTFASAFKKQTGLTHSFYLKQTLKKEKVTEGINAG